MRRTLVTPPCYRVTGERSPAAARMLQIVTNGYRAETTSTPGCGTLEPAEISPLRPTKDPSMFSRLKLIPAAAMAMILVGCSDSDNNKPDQPPPRNLQGAGAARVTRCAEGQPDHRHQHDLQRRLQGRHGRAGEERWNLYRESRRHPAQRYGDRHWPCRRGLCRQHPVQHRRRRWRRRYRGAGPPAARHAGPCRLCAPARAARRPDGAAGRCLPHGARCQPRGVGTGGNICLQGEPRPGRSTRGRLSGPGDAGR